MIGIEDAEYTVTTKPISYLSGTGSGSERTHTNRTTLPIGVRFRDLQAPSGQANLDNAPATAHTLLRISNPMNPPSNNLPPLKNITESGTYILKLIRPKDEKAADRFKMSKPDETGREYAACSLFFLDGDGNCLTERFHMKWHAKKLAIVIGKFSGRYASTPSDAITVEELWAYVEPAFGKAATVELEVTPNGEWQGKPQYRYKFKSIVPHTLTPGAKMPKAGDEPTTNVPF